MLSCLSLPWSNSSFQTGGVYRAFLSYWRGVWNEYMLLFQQNTNPCFTSPELYTLLLSASSYKRYSYYNISFGSCSQSEQTSLHHLHGVSDVQFSFPPPKNRPVFRLITFISQGYLMCTCSCMSTVPRDDPSYHPGCIPASCPVFLGIGSWSTTTLTRTVFTYTFSFHCQTIM